MVQGWGHLIGEVPAATDRAHQLAVIAVDEDTSATGTSLPGATKRSKKAKERRVRALACCDGCLHEGGSVLRHLSPGESVPMPRAPRALPLAMACGVAINETRVNDQRTCRGHYRTMCVRNSASWVMLSAHNRAAVHLAKVGAAVLLVEGRRLPPLSNTATVMG